MRVLSGRWQPVGEFAARREAPGCSGGGELDGPLGVSGLLRARVLCVYRYFTFSAPSAWCSVAWLINWRAQCRCIRFGGILMRIRTAAASVGVTMLALLGSTACSASSGDTPPSRNSESAEEGGEQQQVSRSELAVDPSRCAVPTDEMPEECEVHPSFAATQEGSPAEGMPTPAPSN